MPYNIAIHVIDPAPSNYRMAGSKIYLDVPYAQKDEAKTLGARWDASNKKWYVPANKDISLFAKWQTVSPPLESATASRSRPASQTPAANNGSSASNNARGVFTYPSIKDFIAYDGDEPPWD